MRINCVIGPFLPIPPLMGGAVERVFLALCIEFARKGHDVVMISRRYDNLADDEWVDGIHHIRVPSFEGPSNEILYRIYDVIYALRVRKILPEADLTITHSVSLPVLLSKRQAGKIYVSVNRFPKGQMGLYRRVGRLQAVSSDVANAIRDQSPSVAGLVRVIPNCLSEAFARASQLERGQREKVILFVGRIAREKGIDLLLRAFAMLSADYPEWRLVVVGPHEQRQGGDGSEFLSELKAPTAGMAERVEFSGPVFGEARLIELFRRADIFVYPSVAGKGEAFGLAPLEAMACGCATITSKLPCFLDFIAPGENGLQFDHSDPTGRTLADNLRALLESDDFRVRLAERGKATSRTFAPDAVADLFIEDFKSLIESS